MTSIEWLSFGFSVAALGLSFTYSLVITILTRRRNQSQFGAILTIKETKKGFVSIKNIGRGCAYLISLNVIDFEGKTFSSPLIEMLSQNQEQEIRMDDLQRRELFSLFSDKYKELIEEKCDVKFLTYLSFQNEFRQSKKESFLINESYYLPIHQRIFRKIKRIFMRAPRTDRGKKLAEKRFNKLLQKMRK